MADPPDLAALAKRYVDLWQDQLIALAAHPELAEGLARLLASFPQPGFAARDGNGAAADRPAPAPAPSRGGDRELRDIASRLAALEERLARLEAGASGGGKRPRKAARRRRV
jgi:hypothetical protein